LIGRLPSAISAIDNPLMVPYVMLAVI